MIVRTDSEGEEIWRRIYTNDEDITLALFGTVVETPDGGFAMGQYTGAYNVRLSRVSSEGDFIWTTLYHVGGGQYSSYSLILMEDFGYVLGGFSGVGDWLVRTEPDSLSEIAWDLQVSEETHDFGEVTLDSTVTWELTLTNEAEYPVIIQSVTTDSAVFSIEFDDVLTLEPDEEASIPVSFTPTESREYSGSLTVHNKFRDVVVELSGIGVPLSVIEESNLPLEFALYAVYPNPFNDAVQVQYSLPEVAEIKVAVYDLSGREVVTLINGVQTAGAHQTYWNSEGMASGSYVIHLESAGVVRTQKLALIK